eukprot:2962586-Amphidinium_carterae.1
MSNHIQVIAGAYLFTDLRRHFVLLPSQSSDPWQWHARIDLQRHYFFISRVHLEQARAHTSHSSLSELLEKTKA